MGTWQLRPETWTCPSCGKSAVEGHHQVACHGADGKDWAWTTKKGRIADPSLKACRAQQLVWITDDTWMTCDGCKRDLSDDEVAKVNAYKSTIDWSKMTIHEEVGPVIVNDYAVARVSVDAPSNETYSVGPAEFVGKIPLRQYITVLPADG